MSERPFSLENFIPKKDLGKKVHFREDFAPVVERISKIIPPDLLWDIFSTASNPEQTGGRVEFPYSRVDSSVLIVRDSIYLLENYGHKHSPEKFKENYNFGCKQAFEALLWVEIGFQGLENLAKSPASKNWTSAVGHTVTAEQRAEGIMTTGKEMFDKCLTSFAVFRQQHGIKDDLFSQYKVEYLLDRFLPPNNSPLVNK